MSEEVRLSPHPLFVPDMHECSMPFWMHPIAGWPPLGSQLAPLGSQLGFEAHSKALYPQGRSQPGAQLSFARVVPSCQWRATLHSATTASQVPASADTCLDAAIAQCI